jgi:hypothetical protein
VGHESLLTGGHDLSDDVWAVVRRMLDGHSIFNNRFDVSLIPVGIAGCAMRWLDLNYS